MQRTGLWLYTYIHVYTVYLFTFLFLSVSRDKDIEPVVLTGSFYVWSQKGSHLYLLTYKYISVRINFFFSKRCGLLFFLKSEHEEFLI